MICVEDPQVPGSFLGENAWRAALFMEKYRSTALCVKRDVIGHEQSILARVFQGATGAAITARREKVREVYQQLMPIECLRIEGDEQLSSKEERKPMFRRSRAEGIMCVRFLNCGQ
jgi:hypothetical protein